MKNLLRAAMALAFTVSATLATAAPAPTADGAAQPKVLRYSFLIAETGFDPAQISDTYSRTITPHIFEALYGYDPIAMPVKIVPLTAAALPEVSADFRTYTIKLRPGIFFTDDPAFKGKPRELIAADYVYSFKRFVDPAVKSPMQASVEELGIVGLNEQRKEVLQTKKPFDYDRPVEGLRALDRYTLEIRVAKPRPRLIEALAQNDLFGAVAREVVEAYGTDIMAHPVGTGPFKLAKWRRSSLIALERNEAYRERVYESTPAADDAEGQAIAAQLRGRKLPMIDRVEISIIEESQPRWLSFVNGQHDLVDRVPPEFVHVGLPNNKVAPNLAKRGIKLYRLLNADASFVYYNMEDAIVGGYTADKVALRRALSLAWDVPREIRLLRRGQAIVGQSMVVPHTSGYDPAYKSEMGDFDPARAAALLDMYGYVDKDGDGYRDMPDGKPLVLEWATQPDSLSRSYDEMFRVNMERLKIRTKFPTGKWPEQLKQARAGKLQMWFLGNTAPQPDGVNALQRLYGPQSLTQNYSQFKHARFDQIYDRMQELPDGPEREALFLEAKRIQAAYMPLKTHVHRFVNDMAYDHVIGYRRPLFRNEFWQYIDIDNSKRRQSLQ